MNQHLEQLGYEARVDSRSYKNQGRQNEIPSIHMGPSSRYIKMLSDRKQINEDIKKYNHMALMLQKEIDRISERMRELSAQAEAKLEELQRELNHKYAEQELINQKLRPLQEKLQMLQETIQKIERQKERTLEANKKSSEKIEKLESRIKKYTIFNVQEKISAKKQIQMEEKNIQDRNLYMQGIIRQHGLTDIKDLQQLINQCSEADAEYQQMTDQAFRCAEAIKKIMEDYAQCMTWIIKSYLPLEEKTVKRRKIGRK